VVVAVVARGQPPPEDAAEAGGFFVAKTGLVATARSVVARAGRGREIWVRPHEGRWMPAVEVGVVGAGDLAVLRVVSVRRDFRPLAFGPVETALLGRVLAVAGPAAGRRAVVTGSALASITWFDPSRPSGVQETPRGAGRTVGRGARAISLRFADDVHVAGRDGSPVLDAEGRCVGMVGSEGSPAAVARAADLLAPLVERVVADGTWNPADLGVRLATPGGAPQASLPPELAAAREKSSGGAVVADVALGGPSQAILWQGDVVLEIGGVPVFHEAPESFAVASAALVPDVPADVVVWRGGKRKTLSVVPRPARSVYRDFAAEEQARAAGAPLRR
jgi:serine protease Do